MTGGDIYVFPGTGGCTQMLLITDYHQNGSLYDFLKYDEIDEEQMVRKLSIFDMILL